MKIKYDLETEDETPTPLAVAEALIQEPMWRVEELLELSEYLKVYATHNERKRHNPNLNKYF